VPFLKKIVNWVVTVNFFFIHNYQAENKFYAFFSSSYTPLNGVKRLNFEKHSNVTFFQLKAHVEKKLSEKRVKKGRF